MSTTNIRSLFTTSLNLLILNLGTNVGTIISILSLFGMGFTAGTYYNDYKKNIEILDLKKSSFTELKDLRDKSQLLILEKKELETDKNLLVIEVKELHIKLEKNERESKK